MDRRALLKSLGASMAVALLPREAMAAWVRVGELGSGTGTFTAAQLALIDAVADTIIPRTDTPGAVDVNVSSFVDVIVGENYSDEERRAFLGGVDALHTIPLAVHGRAFAQLSAKERGDVLDGLERIEDRRTQPARTYWRLKGLIVHGYFTSERVMKDVLHHVVMPGKFDGAAPMPPRPVLAGKPRG